jgi:hypothetical protein
MGAGHLGRTSFRIPRGMHKQSVRLKCGRIAFSGYRSGFRDVSDEARWCLAMIKICAAEKHRSFLVLASWKEAEGLASRLPLRQPSTTTFSLLPRTSTSAQFCDLIYVLQSVQRAQCLPITTIPNLHPFCTTLCLNISIQTERAVVLGFKLHISSK